MRWQRYAASGGQRAMPHRLMGWPALVSSSPPRQDSLIMHRQSRGALSDEPFQLTVLASLSTAVFAAENL
jgi:hypothetical protein